MKKIFLIIYSLIACHSMYCLSPATPSDAKGWIKNPSTDGKTQFSRLKQLVLGLAEARSHKQHTDWLLALTEKRGNYATQALPDKIDAAFPSNVCAAPATQTPAQTKALTDAQNKAADAEKAKKEAQDKAAKAEKDAKAANDKAAKAEKDLNAAHKLSITDKAEIQKLQSIIDKHNKDMQAFNKAVEDLKKIADKTDTTYTSLVTNVKDIASKITSFFSSNQ